jgi:hypothetical protein
MPRVCVYPRICHLLRCAYPSDVHGYAKRFDEMLLNALARAAGIAGGHRGRRKHRHRKRPHIPPRGHGRVGDAPVGRFGSGCLAGAAAALPSFIDRRITKHTGNKENGAGKGPQGKRQRPKHELHRQQQQQQQSAP